MQHNHFSAQHCGLSVHHITVSYYKNMFERNLVTDQIIDYIFESFFRTEKRRCLFIREFKNEFLSEIEYWEKISPRGYLSEDILRELDDVYTRSLNWSSLMRTIPTCGRKKVTTFIRSFLLDILEEELKMSSSDRAAAIRREEELASVFSLQKNEIELLKYCIAVELDEYDFENSIASLGNSRRSSIKTASQITGLDQAEISYLMKSKNNLLKSGVLSQCSRSRNSLGVDVDESVLQFASGLEAVDSIMNSYIYIDRKKPLSLRSFTTKKEYSEIIKDILNCSGPANILLHGRAGTGKTEYARSLVRSVKKRPVFVTTRKSSSGRGSRQIALEAAINIVTENDVLIVDEADYLINSMGFFRTPHQDKGWINDLLDRSNVKMIWITNHTQNVEESHLRRFSFSLLFDSFGSAERKKIWKNIVGHGPLASIIDSEKIEHYSNEYEVNAAGIASACEAASSIIKENTKKKKNVLAIIENILEQHEQLIKGRPHKKERLFNIAAEYNVDFINTSLPADDLVEPLSQIANFIRTKSDKEYNANILLYGIPGTGKTEFVKYLASQLKLKICLKRASDLLSPYVGETEMLINRAFREAEKSGQILFIDEADTFFKERTAFSRSWELSQTNELLSQMENFKGILICATNMKSLLDSAAIRRFNFKVQFNALKTDQYLPVYKDYFSKLTGLPKKRDLDKLMTISELTLGDFRAVANAYKFVAKKDITPAEIIGRLAQESSHRDDKKEKQVGFA
ncbi:MAG TPA: AAA family ATPase [Spirochaetota bacterium]|nr:AAA family ATPase [Spirochaetota bacterium]